MIRYITIAMLFILCWIFIIAIEIKDKELAKANKENLRLLYSLEYKNKQLDSCRKIINSDKIVLFNGKIIYW